MCMGCCVHPVSDTHWRTQDITMKLQDLLRVTLVCAGMAAGTQITRAQDQVSDPKVFLTDVDGDGKAETISRRKSDSKEEIGTFYQIFVKDASGAVLWKSPATFDSAHPLAFGEWHFGISLPQLVADVDRDGIVELIAPAPQSDVSPTFFRVLEWVGDGFAPRHVRALSGKGQKGALFKWTDEPSLSGWWVQQWLGAGDGGWVVEMVSMPEGEELRIATGVLAAKGDGFELVRWMKPPSKVGPTTEDGTDVAPSITYRARLSSNDHVNSSGTSLKSVMDILRQDRVNYHRDTHRDAEDSDDGQFSTPAARATLAAMPVQVLGGARAEASILKGSPVVDVTISKGAVRVEIVNTKSPPPSGTPADTAAAEDPNAMVPWWNSQPWMKALRKSLPRGVTVFVQVAPYDAEGWADVELREDHAADSGFDPNVSPMVGLFRVSRKDKRIEWMEPVSGEYEPLDGFLRKRGLKP